MTNKPLSNRIKSRYTMYNKYINTKLTVIVIIGTVLTLCGCTLSDTDSKVSVTPATISVVNLTKPAADIPTIPIEVIKETTSDGKTSLTHVSLTITDDNNEYGQQVTNPDTAAAALSAFKDTLGISDIREEFRADTTDIINDNFRRYNFRQYHQKLPVLNGHLSLQTDDEGNLISIDGYYKRLPELEAEARISKAAALDIAADYIKDKYELEGVDYYCKGLAIWCDPSSDEIKVCYSICLNKTVPKEKDSGENFELKAPEYTVAIDVQTGKILSKQNV